MRPMAEDLTASGLVDWISMTLLEEVQEPVSMGGDEPR